MTLRLERESVGIAQAEVARRLGVDSATVSRSERLPLERVRRRTVQRYRQALAEIEGDRQLQQRRIGAAFVETGLVLLGEAL